MDEYSSREDTLPVTWLRGHPIYAAHLIALAYVASMITTTILLAFNASHLWGWLPFASASVLRGEVWRVATYGLVNPPSLWFAVDMVMIAMFGREVERFFGRRRFLALYACIYLLPAVLFTALGFWVPTQLMGETGAFALFIAFATLYPDAMMLFGMTAKWAAAILIGIFSLMAVAYHDWTGGASLWATSAFAYAAVRFERGELALPRVRLPWRRPRLRVIDGGQGRGAGPTGPGSMEEVDTLLDKIARSGISSLTREERVTLDSARERLARREPRR
jgi:membrane associated rhomboid family serine protease